MATGGNMERILRLMAEKGASDCYLSANMPVLIRINGQTVQLSDQILTPPQPRQLISEVIDPASLAELDNSGELNLAVSVSGGQFPAVGLSPAWLDCRRFPAYPAHHSVAGQPQTAALLGTTRSARSAV